MEGREAELQSRRGVRTNVVREEDVCLIGGKECRHDRGRAMGVGKPVVSTSDPSWWQG